MQFWWRKSKSVPAQKEDARAKPAANKRRQPSEAEQLNAQARWLIARFDHCRTVIDLSAEQPVYQQEVSASARKILRHIELGLLGCAASYRRGGPVDLRFDRIALALELAEELLGTKNVLSQTSYGEAGNQLREFSLRLCELDDSGSGQPASPAWLRNAHEHFKVALRWAEDCADGVIRNGDQSFSRPRLVASKMDDANKALQPEACDPAVENNIALLDKLQG